MFCLRNRTDLKIFLPLGSLRKVTKRGLELIAGLVGAFCTTGFVGDLIDNHRIFLNMEVMFCMKPELVLPVLLLLPLIPEVDFRLVDDIATSVDFLSCSKEFVCSSVSLSSVDEFSSPQRIVCADIELVNLSKFVVLFLRYLIGFGLFLPAPSLKLLLFEIEVCPVVSEAYLFCSSKISWR